ncbi:uncharacterized protein LOC132388354 isoform X1 [Hypanus sabinus]|uniref:uncharacterized protein LOC132388354 isoform X1 n=2 Tax=Hypanus sabinus TaxID=79690 RepID=UPI0028C4AD8E|nr:uncharacterized protein LOC132388354 isoform X1 [Hypanus sabinus]
MLGSGDAMDVANHSVVLLQQLNVQREFGFLCDCTVAVGDIHFKAHRAVLAAFSNYFKMIFIHQSSDYIKVQPMDIQPDIFSYLLHLMYTGKGPKQPVDPNRLEEGIRFLHAYNLVHDPSQGGQVFTQHPEVPSLQSPNLYGIQISGSQKLPVPPGSRSGVTTLTTEQTSQMTLGVANIPEHRYARPPIGQEVGAEESGQSLPPSSAAASRGLQVPGLNFKRSKTHKLYSCHYCGERFSARGSLRDHLYSHASGAVPAGAPIESRGLGEEAEGVGGSLSQGDEALPSTPDQQEGSGLDEQPPVGLTVTIGACGDTVDPGSGFTTAKRRRFTCSVCGHSADPEPSSTPPPTAAPPGALEESPAAAQPQARQEEAVPSGSPDSTVDLESAFRDVFASYEAARVHAHYKCVRTGCERVAVSAEPRRGDRFVHKWLSDRELTYCERTGVYWLLYEEGQGMFCYLCRRHDTQNKQNKTKVFNGTPAVRYKKSALQVHAESQQHAAAVHAELAGRMSEREMAERERQEGTSLRALFLAAYWLAREGLPTAKLRPALRLLGEAGLAGGATTHFRRADTLQEVFRGLGTAVRQRLVSRICRAPAFGIRCERAGPGAESSLLAFAQFIEPGVEVASGLLFAEAPGPGRGWDSADELAAVISRTLGCLELPVSRLASLVTDGGEAMPAVVSRLRELSPALLGLHCVSRRLLLAAASGCPTCRPLLRVEAYLQQLWEVLERSHSLAEAYLSARLAGASAAQPSGRLKPALLRRLRRACRRRRLSLEASVEGAYNDYVALLRALSALSEAEAAAVGLLAQLGSLRFAGALYILREASAALLGLSRAWRRGGLHPPALESLLRQALQRLEEAASSRAALTRLRVDLEPGGRLSCCALPTLGAGDEAELSGLLETYTARLVTDLRRRFEASAPLLATLSIFNPHLVPDPGSTGFAAHGQAEVGALASHFHPRDPATEARLQAEWARLKLELPGWKVGAAASSLGESSATECCLRRLLGLGTYPALMQFAEVALSAPVAPARSDRAFAALRRLEARLRGGRCEDTGLLDSLLQISVNGPELGTAECTQLIQEAALAFLQQRCQGTVVPAHQKPPLASFKAEEAAEACCSEGSEQELEQLQQELDQTVGALQLQADNESDSEDSLCD